MTQKRKSIVLSLIAVVLVGALAVGAYFLYDAFKPEVSEGKKSVTITISDSTDTVQPELLKSYSFESEAKFLAELFAESEIVTGTEGIYGFEIKSVVGIEADNSKNQYWAIYVNGEYGQYGAASQPVNDGDSFELKLESWQ